jgi:HAD superfamily hydrolase (TIGR01509 family)
MSVGAGAIALFVGAARAETVLPEEKRSMRIEPVFLFDLDGTLVDSVYQHVLAWKEALDSVRRLHAHAYRRMADRIRPLPGARELLAWLTDAGIQWAIATSGRMETAAVNLTALGVDPARTPVVTRDQVKYAKPDPDLFLAAAARLNAPIERAVVVGDSIWDMLAAARCRALGVGLLCGGYGAGELQQAMAFRVYEDPADLLVHIDELGGRR